MRHIKCIGLLICSCVIFASAVTATEFPTFQEIQQVAEQFGEAADASLIVGESSRWQPDLPEYVPSWTLLREQMLGSGTDYAPGNEIPYVMMAGYFDTDVTWEDGGLFTMLAWVWDPDNDVEFVELYYEGEPTGVFLLDNGQSGDFGANDTIYGLTFQIDPYTLPAGEYILELRAQDANGNVSDLWPYLTVHP